jgi:uncharacterized protein
MSVDLEAIAQRGRCDVSSLRLALPLLEQGYSPPFLARYRRDELGGLDESTLWALSAALQTEHQIAARRDELVEAWEQTSLTDPAIGHAIKKANSQRMLARLARRLKTESREGATDSAKLAVRVLNPQHGDGSDPVEIASKVESIEDSDGALAGLDASLAKRLAGDPRLISAAVRWLAKHAKIHIANISDPHVHDDGPEDEADEAEAADESSAGQHEAAAASEQTVTPATPVPAAPAPVAAPEAQPEPTQAVDAPTTAGEPDSIVTSQASDVTALESASPESSGSEQAAQNAAGERTENTPASETESVAEPVATDEPATPPTDMALGFEPSSAADQAVAKQRPAKAASKPKKQKKISPRQRRRRWLVGVLKSLEGKRLTCDKLSAFQVVMLGRALRSQVAECSFEYDATKLVAELQRVAAGLNRNFEDELRQLVLEHEASIREAAETAWWDDLLERASARLVGITADHLSRHVNRGAVDARIVLAIDAVGPRTAAAAIVSSDGRLLHSEDLPCQLSAAQRSQAVNKIGELIHTYHVDLLVISNGPARRATMIALSDLIAQSPEGSVRWTLADRGGADAYASSGVANEEMRTTPRRFRAAAWLAFSVLQPAQALAKVDPLKLRLSSFQRELSDDAIAGALQDVMTSGASRGGVDANSAPVSWLQKLPGVSSGMAKAIDRARREHLFESRQAVLELDQWESTVASRQAIAFLRVFGAGEALDGTLIHPEDYPLAKKLATALDIELPPNAPPGYVAPDYSQPTAAEEPGKLVEVKIEKAPAPVEDFSVAGEKAREFALEQSEPAQASEPDEAAQDETTEDGVPDLVSTETESNASGSSETESLEATAAADPAVDESISTDGTAAAVESISDETTGEQGAGEASKPAVAPPEVHQRVLRPKPDRAKTEKCIKEWQIGTKRAHQLVQWLCDPFGDSDASGTAPAVLKTMPSLTSLKPGDQTIGVVVGVMPFGVFVELAPDCGGLIHVSRVSDAYVEDLHEAVQVGDVITAWVSGIDEKRRRVALSAVSPEREAELEEARQARAPHGRGGGPRGGRSGQGGQHASGGRQGAPRTESGGGQSTGQRRGKPAQSGQAAGQDRGGRPPRSGGGQGRGAGQGRGGQGRGAGQGRGRDQRGGKREKKPESYRVVSKQEVKPISEAMQKGEEPLRSFGDLLQFFDQSKSVPKEPKQPTPSETQPTGAAQPTAAPQPLTEPTSVDREQASASEPKPQPQAGSSEARQSNHDSDTPPKQDETSSADAST